MSSNTILLNEAIENYKKAIKSGTCKEINCAKRQLDKARQLAAENDGRSYDELVNLFKEAIKNNNISEAVQYYYSAQAVKKKAYKSCNKSFEDQVMDEVIKAMGEEIC